MASLGLNVARDGSTSVATLTELRCTWARIVAMPEHDTTQFMSLCRANGIKLLLVIAKESQADQRQLEQYRAKYGELISAVQVGNEPDHVSDSSWTMSQQELATLGHLVRSVFPTHAIVCGGLASGQPTWLDGADLSWCDALAVHPYLKDAPDDNDIEDLPDVNVLLAEYRQYARGKSMLVTEWGWWGTEDKRAYEEVQSMTAWAAATQDVAVFMYFCVSDTMVPPFGLLDAQGNKKAQYEAFRREARNAVPSAFPDTVTPVDFRAYARAAAERNALDPELFVRQIQQESQFDPDAYNASSGAAGIAQIVERFHPGVNVWDPLASLDYAAQWVATLRESYGGDLKRALVAYNWGPRNANTWDGTRATLPQETAHYLDVILGPNWAPVQPTRVTYNRNEPVHPQEEDFDCSQESLEWVFWAYGRQTSDDWLENTMLAEGVMTRRNGLEDASGAGLADFVNRHYNTLGYTASNDPQVTFDDLVNEFPPGCAYPAVIGGRAWNHWSALREYDAALDVLKLANPADGHKGVSQTMTREQFAALGPFSMVRVVHRDVINPPTEPETPPVNIADKRRKLHNDIRALTRELDAISG